MDGGNALNILYPINVTNNGIIGGGGGGGGGSAGGPRGGCKDVNLGRTNGTFDGKGGKGGIGSAMASDAGGDGGDIGIKGKSGGDWPRTLKGGAGGLAGFYVDGNSNITWVKLGDARGNKK